MLELGLLTIVLLLLAIICFLLYRIYKIKYRAEEGKNSTFIPQIEDIDEKAKQELKFNSKLADIETKISDLEDSIQEQEKNMKRLAEAIGNE